MGKRKRNTSKTSRKRLKRVSEKDTDEKTLKIYTDGSCDLFHQVCGCGVYFKDFPNRSISTSDVPGRKTNQRAELQAIYLALVETKNDNDITIYTDSLYSINCITKVFNAKVNLDIIENIDSELQTRDEKKQKYNFRHVYGHSGNFGNEEADKLAKSAMRAKRETIIEESTDEENGSEEDDTDDDVDDDGEDENVCSSEQQ